MTDTEQQEIAHEIAARVEMVMLDPKKAYVCVVHSELGNNAMRDLQQLLAQMGVRVVLSVPPHVQIDWLEAPHHPVVDADPL